MRKVLILLALLIQLGALAVMAGKREWIRETGERIYLRTAPIDPRDPFRGDFVRLSYAINMPEHGALDEGLASAAIEKGTPVYASLVSGGDGVYGLEKLTRKRPESSIFIKGRTVSRARPDLSHPVQVKYGIEQYFVEQGAGREIESRRGTRDGVQVPMEVEVAVGRDGTPVLRGYRWSPLGVELEVLEAPAIVRPGQPPVANPRQSPRLRLTIHNVSQRQWSLVNPGPNCAFTLRPSGGLVADFTMVDTQCLGSRSRAEDVIHLEPGQSHAFEFDLASPRWHVRTAPQPGQPGQPGQTGEIGQVAPQTWFRLVYRAPAIQSGAVPNLWAGELPGRGFSAGGRMD